jgi:hypothetical protein
MSGTTGSTRNTAVVQAMKTPYVEVNLDQRTHGTEPFDPLDRANHSTHAYFTIVWRGVEHEVSVESKWYGHMGEWWIIPRYARPALTEAASKRVREAVTAPMMEWIESPAYAESVKASIASKVRREIADERYSTTGPRRMLARYEACLDPETVTKLEAAIEALEAFFAAMKACE